MRMRVQLRRLLRMWAWRLWWQSHAGCRISAMTRMTIWSRCSTCNLETAQPNRHLNQTGHDQYTVSRWTEPQSYRAAHRLVHAVRGHPAEHTCPCGNPAFGWSLTERLHVFGEARWSPDPNDYDALCVPCHKKRDWPADKWRERAIEARREAGRRGAAALKAKRAVDPDLDARIRTAISANGKRVANDPEHQKKMKEGLRKKREDPEFERKFIDDKKKAAMIRNAGCGGRR